MSEGQCPVCGTRCEYSSSCQGCMDINCGWPGAFPGGGLVPTKAERRAEQQERHFMDLSKCSDGRTHILYAIESGGWVEEVGCERCTLKIAGRKSPDLEFVDAEVRVKP